MTPHGLKELYLASTAGTALFFSKDTMAFLGDRMSNFGVTLCNVEFDGEVIEVYELYRKRPVEGGLQSSAYFLKDGNLLYGATPL